MADRSKKRMDPRTPTEKQKDYLLRLDQSLFDRVFKHAQETGDSLKGVITDAIKAHLDKASTQVQPK